MQWLRRVLILRRAYTDLMAKDDHSTADSERTFTLLQATGLKPSEAHALLRLIEEEVAPAGYDWITAQSSAYPAAGARMFTPAPLRTAKPVRA